MIYYAVILKLLHADGTWAGKQNINAQIEVKNQHKKPPEMLTS